MWEKMKETSSDTFLLHEEEIYKQSWTVILVCLDSEETPFEI